MISSSSPRSFSSKGTKSSPMPFTTYRAPVHHVMCLNTANTASNISNATTNTNTMLPPPPPPPLPFVAFHTPSTTHNRKGNDDSHTSCSYHPTAVPLASKEIAWEEPSSLTFCAGGWTSDGDEDDDNKRPVSQPPSSRQEERHRRHNDNKIHHHHNDRDAVVNLVQQQRHHEYVSPRFSRKTGIPKGMPGGTNSPTTGSNSRKTAFLGNSTKQRIGQLGSSFRRLVVGKQQQHPVKSSTSSSPMRSRGRHY